MAQKGCCWMPLFALHSHQFRLVFWHQKCTVSGRGLALGVLCDLFCFDRSFTFFFFVFFPFLFFIHWVVRRLFLYVVLVRAAGFLVEQLPLMVRLTTLRTAPTVCVALVRWATSRSLRHVDSCPLHQTMVYTVDSVVFYLNFLGFKVQFVGFL